MDNPLNLSSCDFNRYQSWQNVVVIWAPVYSIPVYLSAIFLVKQYSDSQNNRISKAQLLAVFFNYSELIVMSTMFFPQFQIPVLGLQVGGVARQFYPRVITFIVVALVIHHGINSTTLFIAHLRLMLLSRSLVLRKTSLNQLVSKSHQLACITYVLLVLSVISILLLFNVDDIGYQNTWKKELFAKYQFPFIWCPEYYVLDPTVWEFAVMMGVASSATVIFAVVFVMCSLTTIAIVQSAKDTMSVQSVRYHMHVVTSFLISCAIQAFFVVLPVLHMLLCVYFEVFKVYTGDFLYYSLLTQAHQGTAFTMFYVMFHRKTRKMMRKVGRMVRKVKKSDKIFKRSLNPSHSH